MRGLSLTPPYATLMAIEAQHSAKGKRIETRGRYTAYAAALGITLVTKTGLTKRGYRLKRGAMPVGKRYYGAPLSHYADLFVLECQAVRIPNKKGGMIPKHTYTIQIATPRQLTETEVETVVSASLATLAGLLAVPDETPRHVEKIVIRPRPERQVDAA